MRILLTSFEPFDGRPSNGSNEIGTQIVKNIEGKIRSVVVEHLENVPVVYDRAAEFVMDHLVAMRDKPSFVVSLGEAQELVQIETGAQNLDNTPTLADNSGTKRIEQKILEGEGSDLGFGFPVWQLWNAVPMKERDTLFKLSRSPGSFVCNNTAYHLTVRLEKLSIPFTFIHTPRTQFLSELIVQKISTILAQGLWRAGVEIEDSFLNQNKSFLKGLRIPRTQLELSSFRPNNELGDAAVPEEMVEFLKDLNPLLIDRS